MTLAEAGSASGTSMIVCRFIGAGDIWTSAVIIVGYAIPGFILAILLIVLFAGGSYFSVFPLRGLTSDNFADLSFFGKAMDYAWHLVLPLIAMGIGGFATTTLLTKNSFLDEIKKQYVITARASGTQPRRPYCLGPGTARQGRVGTAARDARAALRGTAA